MTIPEIARRLNIGRLAVYTMLEPGSFTSPGGPGCPPADAKIRSFHIRRRHRRDAIKNRYI